MASSTRGQRVLGKAIALLALTALLANGCDRAEEPQTNVTPTPSSQGAGADASKPADPPAKPAATPATDGAPKPDDKGDAKPDGVADEKPKLPPIPHEDVAKDAKPIREWTTPTGVIVHEFKEGTGMPTLPKAVATMHYVLFVKDGWKKVDSTWEKGAAETHSLQDMVYGMSDGMMGMKPGGMRRIIVPPERGFDQQDIKDNDDNIVIPAGSTLVFDVDLISVKQTIVEKSTPKTEPKPSETPGTPKPDPAPNK